MNRSFNQMVRIAQMIPATEAEGPGRRLALWFQGCPLRCPGCCNPEMLPFEGGREVSIAFLGEELKRIAQTESIEGISLLGGEPLAHAAAALALAKVAKDLGLSVMVYSGYTLEQARDLEDPNVGDLLNHIDILVDGPYIREQSDTTRRWVGSTNQRIHFLTNRYHANDPCWRKTNTLEIRLRGRELTVNGFPAKSAVGIWKRPKSNHQ